MPEREERDASAAAAEVWLRVLDGLVGGIHHALNNRTAALAAVAQVLEGEIPPTSPLSGVFRQEMERMRATVGLLSQLPRARSERPQPVRPGDLVADLQGLFGMHHDLRDIPLAVEVEAGVLPVWTDPAQLVHILMVLLAAAAHDARAHPGAEVRLEIGGDAERVWMVVRAARTDAPPDPWRAEPPAGPAVEPVPGEVVRVWLEEAGGSLSLTPGGDGETVYRAELPSLLAVRRREGG